MSRATQTASATPEQKRSSAKAERPKLRVIDHASLKREALRRGVLMGGMIVLATCLFAIAFVHAQLVQDQHQLDVVNTEIVAGLERTAQLERDVMIASSPVAIVERAEALGMVRSQHPEYLVAVHYEAANVVFGSPEADAVETAQADDQ